MSYCMDHKIKEIVAVGKVVGRLHLGPYNQHSLSHYTYMMTIVDDYSRNQDPTTNRQDKQNGALLAVAASACWFIHQLDVNNAFLHGYLDEEIYMEALSFIALLVYVDDILITGPSEEQITEVKCYLDELFTIKDLGPVKYFLGLEIARASEGLALTQGKYIGDILNDMGLQDAKTTTTPLPAGIKFTTQSDNVLPHPAVYRRLVGRLLYLNFTRLDIAHATQQLSQFLQTPCQQHWDAAVHLVKYLKGTKQKRLFFPHQSALSLKAYCDADWASCPDTRTSLTGYCIFLGPALISWKTKKQNTISRSTAEAEYRAMGTTACELVWINSLLQDLQVSVPKPIPFLCDNRAALHIVSNPMFHERTKHLEIDCHLVRDHYKFGFLAPHVTSKDQLVDVFTKSLVGPLFHSLIRKLGMIDFIPCPA
ncbi:UNVERIFIED_CONTAM: Retrovirus-related Pol polyprotein from transposon RE2 [Sesamum calycinum]|uniref:Retrovirus-related Pol polyprotein from transposon RE2 n=1 Tax=Sesamum calycinum TaxID=2727403 RepID=A0AAW2NE73_9LAMI